MLVMWTPSDIFRARDVKYKLHRDFAVVVLNQELPLPSPVYKRVWDNSIITIAADGGANRVFEKIIPEWEARDHMENPNALDLDIIIGDLDSLEQVPRRYWERHGSQLIYDSDQDTTDFHKAVSFLRRWDRQSQRAYIECKKYTAQVCRLNVKAAITAEDDVRVAPLPLSGTNRDIVVIGGVGGRLDQGMSTLHHMYFFQQDPLYAQGRMFLLSSENISMVLKAGDHLIQVKDEWLGEHIGIIPMKEPSMVTTHGLRWNVANWVTSFGYQMSTSNHVEDRYVHITTSHDVLFTIDLKVAPSDEPVPALKKEDALADVKIKSEPLTDVKIKREPEDDSFGSTVAYPGIGRANNTSLNGARYYNKSKPPHGATMDGSDWDGAAVVTSLWVNKDVSSVSEADPEKTLEDEKKREAIPQGSPKTSVGSSGLEAQMEVLALTPSLVEVLEDTSVEHVRDPAEI